MSFFNPLRERPTILVAAVGEAEGARGAAAALACAGAELDEPSLLIEVGGRTPRPALLASGAAQKLEERLTTHLPDLRVAARGQVCHLAVPADSDGVEATAAAVAVTRDSTTILHVPSGELQSLLGGGAAWRPSGVLLRADLAADRPLVALAAHDLLDRGIAVAVLKRRLSWVAERRALFGALPAGSPGGLSERVLRRLRLLSKDTEVRVPAAAG